VIQFCPSDDTLLCQGQLPIVRLSGDLSLRQVQQLPGATVCIDKIRKLRHQVIFTLLFAGLLVAAGCRQESGPETFSEKDAIAAREELLKRFPAPPPDTPEQVQQKEATVAESLPKVYELLELAKSDPTKTDEAVELSMSLVALVPSHREAVVAYCKAQLASFFAKEVTNEEGRMVDEHHMAIAIRSATSEIDRLRKDFTDFSEDEVQLSQEIYFHRARLEGFYPLGSDAPELFRDTIGKLVSSGFRDTERLKKEPRFQSFLTDPKFAPALQAAITQMEEAAKDVPATDAAADEKSQKPE
jgi:hypothetical protein